MKSILLLEDSSGPRVWLSSVLLEVFPETHIFAADTVSEAGQIIQAQTLNLAILDINLPDGGGIEQGKIRLPVTR